MSLPEADVVDLGPQRLQIAVLVADDLAPEMHATIEALVKRALAKHFDAHGGELYVGDFAAHAIPPGHIAHTISYAGPRKANAS